MQVNWRYTRLLQQEHARNDFGGVAVGETLLEAAGSGDGSRSLFLAAVRSRRSNGWLRSLMPFAAGTRLNLEGEIEGVPDRLGNEGSRLYYLFCTGAGAGQGAIPIRASQDLYYSLSSFGSRNSAIGLATNLTLDPKSPKYK